MKTIWKPLLCGLIFETFYQLALALRWMSGREMYAALVAAVAGVIIARILWQADAVRVFNQTLGGLGLAFLWHIAVSIADIPWKILAAIDPVVADIGHTTMNEGLTATLVAGIYLFTALAAFLAALGVIALRKTRVPGEASGRRDVKGWIFRGILVCVILGVTLWVLIPESMVFHFRDQDREIQSIQLYYGQSPEEVESILLEKHIDYETGVQHTAGSESIAEPSGIFFRRLPCGLPPCRYDGMKKEPNQRLSSSIENPP